MHAKKEKTKQRTLHKVQPAKKKKKKNINKDKKNWQLHTGTSFSISQAQFHHGINNLPDS